VQTTTIKWDAENGAIFLIYRMAEGCFGYVQLQRIPNMFYCKISGSAALLENGDATYNLG